MATTDPPSDTSAPHPHKVPPAEVGWQFVPQYYTFVNKQPHKLHCFYNRNSTFVHGTEGEDVKVLTGQAEIHAKIVALGFSDCKVYINSVDAQSSVGGGIVIQVIGEMSNKGEPWRKFAQTFFLAEQPNGYYVLNDIFRFLKEETLADSASGGEAAVEAVEEGGTGVAVAEDAQTMGNGYHPELAKEEEQAVPMQIDEVAESEAAAAAPVQEEAPAVVAETTLTQPDAPASTTVVAPTPPAAAPVEQPPEPAAAPPPPPTAPAAEPAPTPVPAATPTEAHSKVTTTTAPTPSKPASTTVVAPTPTPSAPPQTTTPAEPPKPPPQTGPKTWAALASKDATKWGAQVASDAKGLSSAAPPPPAARVQMPPAKRDGGSEGWRGPHGQGQGGQQGGGGAQAAGGEGSGHPAYQAAMAVTTAQCFVKSVTEQIPNNSLRDQLTSRFGPIKELEIVRSKACAFLEFVHLADARKAIASSLPVSQGGEGGIRIKVDGFGGDGEPPLPRISIELRKERGERPPPRPRGGAPPPTGERGGAPGGGERGGAQGGGGGGGGYRGRGGMERGGGGGRGNGERGRGRGPPPGGK